MYNNLEVWQISKFDSYNIIAKLGIMYEYTIKYLNFLLSSKCNRLFAANLIKNSKTISKQIFIFEMVLNNFVL